MEGFKLIVKNSYFDEEDNDVILVSDAIYAMQVLVKEIKDEVASAESLTDVKNFLNKIKTN